MQSRAYALYLKGMTLVELVIGLTLVSIVMGLTMPSFLQIIEANQVRSAAEQLAGQLQFMRYDAIRRQTNIFTSFQLGNNWCYGFNDNSACDCSNSNACVLDSIETVKTASDFKNVTVAINNITGNSFSYDGVRGTSSDPGSITFSKNGKAITLNILTTGRIKLCSDSLPEYPTC